MCAATKRYVRYAQGDTYEGYLDADGLRHGSGTYSYISAAAASTTTTTNHRSHTISSNAPHHPTPHSAFTNPSFQNEDAAHTSASSSAARPPVGSVDGSTDTLGSRYEGEWFEDQKHGPGSLFFADGDVYCGMWLQDKRHGRGCTVHYHPQEGLYTYDGDFRSDSRDGVGIYRRHGPTECVTEMGIFKSSRLTSSPLYPVAASCSDMRREKDLVGFVGTNKEKENDDDWGHSNTTNMNDGRCSSSSSSSSSSGVAPSGLHQGIRVRIEHGIRVASSISWKMNPRVYLVHDGTATLCENASESALSLLPERRRQILLSAFQECMLTRSKCSKSKSFCGTPHKKGDTLNGVGTEHLFPIHLEEPIDLETFPLASDGLVVSEEHHTSRNTRNTRRSSIEGNRNMLSPPLSILLDPVAFARDIEELSRIRHPQLVPVYGLCAIHGVGAGLRTVSALPPASAIVLFEALHAPTSVRVEVMEIGAAVSSALAFLHSKGLTFGALCSFNVLLLPPSGSGDKNSTAAPRVLLNRLEGRWWRLGWVNALKEREAPAMKRIPRTLEQLTRMYGLCPVNWMPPEVLQLRQQPTKEADIYSFSLLLYEILARKIPFEELSVAQLIGYVGFAGGASRLQPSVAEVFRPLPQEIRTKTSECLSGQLEARPTMEAMHKLFTLHLNPPSTARENDGSGATAKDITSSSTSNNNMEAAKFDFPGFRMGEDGGSAWVKKMGLTMSKHKDKMTEMMAKMGTEEMARKMGERTEEMAKKLLNPTLQKGIQSVVSGTSSSKTHNLEEECFPNDVVYLPANGEKFVGVKTTSSSDDADGEADDETHGEKRSKGRWVCVDRDLILAYPNDVGKWRDFMLFRNNY